MGAIEKKTWSFLVGLILGKGQNKFRQALHQIRAAQPLHNQNQPVQIINMPKL
jgi:hypothetical protein